MLPELHVPRVSPVAGTVGGFICPPTATLAFGPHFPLLNRLVMC